MDFSTKKGAPEKHKTGCVVVGIHADAQPSAAAAAIDKACGGQVSRILKQGDMDGDAGSALLLHKLPGVAAERVLLVGLGRQAEVGEKDYLSALSATFKRLGETGARDAHLCLTEIGVLGRDAGWRIEQAVLAAAAASYRFDRLKSKPKTGGNKLHQLTLSPGDDGRPGNDAVARGNAIAAGVRLAKDLGNLPPNVCTPSYLADQARELAKEHKLKIEVLEREDMEKLGMGALLSVTRGSRQPPKFIVIRHRGGDRKRKPVVLVGKGITFDTGGISLKPGDAMDEMKYDMCGAASVLGTMQAVALLDLPLNVIGVVPTCENMPDGNASRPGDIVTSLSGQTVEILNTDAEGRLILCDALTYCERFEPAAVVDIATLTGACVIALGSHASGLFSNNDVLAQEILDAGVEAWDRAWRMPLWADYQEQLKSNFADMANIGGRPAGSITAACFLSRFARKFHWAHLDIAGTAWKSGAEKGSTGRPVGLLTHFLVRRAEGD